MKAFKSTCWKVALATFLFVFCGQAFAQATIGADAAYKSKYIFRGLPWNTEAVFWPDVWFTAQGVTVTIFGSMNLTDIYLDQNKISELDYYFDYTRAFGKVNASIGWAQYTYPNTVYPNTGELYIKAGSDLKILTASVIAYFDLQLAKGIYISPKVSRAFTIPTLPGLTSTLGLSVGYGDKKHCTYWHGFGTVNLDGGMTDFTGTLNLAYALPGELGKHLGISGEVGYSKILAKEIADLYAENGTFSIDGKDHRSNLWFGLGLNYFYTIGGGP